MKVGFIGVGNIGKLMARSLMKAGHSLTVHDLRREAAAELLEEGATWADAPRQVAEASQAVLTSLPGPPQVEAVALGEKGILAGARPGTIYVDLSTSSPDLIRRIGPLARERGVKVLDCGVSRWSGRPGDTNLTLMVGGDENAYREALPVLESIGAKVVYCGPLGSGYVSKIVNNLVSLSLTAVLGEALTLGVKAGVSLEALAECMSNGTGSTRKIKKFLPYGHFAGKMEGSFTLELAAKDVRLATDMGRSLGLPMPFSNLVDQLYVTAKARGWGQQRSDAPMLLMEEIAGVELRLKNPPTE